MNRNRFNARSSKTRYPFGVRVETSNPARSQKRNVVAGIPVTAAASEMRSTVTTRR